MTYSRRQLLVAALACPVALTLTGCGFRMRGQFSVPFSTLYLDMEHNTPFEARVKRLLLAGSDVSLVTSPKDAQAVLRVISKKLERNAVTYNADGNVREYELKLTVQFRLTTPEGAEYLPDSTLTTVRDIYYNEDDYLSRGNEEAILVKDMESDIASMMIRRIEKAKTPENVPALESSTGLVPERRY